MLEPIGVAVVYLDMNGKMTFLIVDNVESNSAVIRVHLKKMGYQNMTWKPNGFEAANYMRTNKVDFVICRMNMPVMTGIELLSEMQNDYTMLRKPFLLFDEDLDTEDLALIKEFEGDAFLSLPFVTKDLAEQVAKTWSKYINPKDPEYFYELARKAFLANNLDESRKVFDALLRAKRLVARSSLGLAKIALKEGRAAEAFSMADSIVEKNPNYIHAHQFLGEVALSSGDPVKAVKHFCQAIAISPKNPYRYQVVSETLMALEQWSSVISILKQAEEKELHYNFVEEGLARALIQMNQFDEAIRYYEILVKRNPKDAAHLNNIAICFKKQNNPGQAIEYYKRALSLDENNVKIMFNLALTLLVRNKTNEATQYLKKIMEIDPGFDKARLKYLEVNDPKAFKMEKQRMAKFKEASASDEHDPGLITTAEQATHCDIPVTASVCSDFDPAEIRGIIADITQRVKDRDEGKIPPLVLPKDVAAKIQKMSVEQVNNEYFRALVGVRGQFEELMSLWLGSILEISTDLVQHITELSTGMLASNQISIQKIFDFISSSDKESHEMFGTLKSAMQGDKKLKDNLVPILSEMQFQDYLRQSVDSLKSAYRISLKETERPVAPTEVLAQFTNEHDKNLFRQIVLGEQGGNTDHAEEGTLLLFE